jgi:26S proteasome regulatory subunit N1
VALNHLKTEVKQSTSSMTSIPKPFKFLRPHYPGMSTLYSQLAATAFKKNFADFLSVLAMSLADPYNGESLKFLFEGTM